MTQTPAKYLVLLFGLSLAYTCLINYFNCQAIRQQNPDNTPRNTRSLVHNSTIYSVDNYWYVNQVRNLIDHGRFTVDINKDRYEVRRTPVYPLFYGLHYWLFGEAKSYYYIRYSQAIILAAAVVCLFLAVWNFTRNSTAAWIAAVLYGAYPVVPVAAWYTMTESLSSELVCFCLYFLSRAYRGNAGIYWWLAGSTFALSVLCRPTIVFLGLSCAWVLWYANRASLRVFLRNGILFALGAFVLVAPWTIRNYRITGEIIFLEKFYGDPMDYGMPNIHLRKWISCWTNPADFTSEQISNTMRANLMQARPAPVDSLVDEFMKEIPSRAFAGTSVSGVRHAFSSLYAYYQSILQKFPSDTISHREAEASQAFIDLRSRFIRADPFGYYVVRNGIFMKSAVFHSYGYALAFLDDYTHSIFKKAVKALLYLLSVLSWMALLFYPVQRRYPAFYGLSVLFAGASIAATIIYLSYYESRYNVPLFPVLFGSLAIVISTAIGKLGHMLQSTKSTIR